MEREFLKIKKIAIMGGPGTGKTTLADQLHEICNLPVIHIDGINYKPNWKTRDTKERDTRVQRKIR